MVFVLWKLNSAVQMCPITLRRKYKLFTQPSLLPMAVTTPSVSSLCFPPISPSSHHSSHTSFLFVPQPANLPAPLRPLHLLFPQRSALSQQSVLFHHHPSREAIPDHPHLTTTPPPHSLRHILSPYTALFIKVLINTKNYIIHLSKMAFICLPH